MLGDASTRAYERLETRMANAHPDDLAAPVPTVRPVVRQALQRDRQTRRRHSSFVAVDNASCARKGLSAPEIFAADLDSGSAVLEDLGSGGRRRRAYRSAKRYASRSTCSPGHDLRTRP